MRYWQVYEKLPAEWLYILCCSCINPPLLILSKCSGHAAIIIKLQVESCFKWSVYV
jgi:hypothetical protein